MVYARIQGNLAVEYPLQEGEIRRRHPQVSFSRPFRPPVGYAAVLPVEPPTVSWQEDLVEGTPEFLDDAWRQRWIVQPASDEQLGIRQAAQAAVVRQERNSRLAASDWTQLPDAAVDQQAWNQYRQALRDVPQQAGFPMAIDWPSEPVAPRRGDYVAFWAALVQTGAYAAIRSQASSNLAMNTVATEFIALIGDAKAGRPWEGAIQAAMAAVLALGSFTPAEREELQAALTAGGLETIYSLDQP